MTNDNPNNTLPSDVAGSSVNPAPPQEQWVPVKFEGTSPRAVYVLIAVTVLVYILQEGSRFLYGGADYAVAFGAKVNVFILQGELWRLFTPMLLHASLIHIGVNMYSLYALGPALEKHYGHWRFLTLYLLGGFAGNVASFMFTEANSLGASTAIFGLVGAYGVFLYQNRRLLGEAAQRGLRNIITVAAINLLIGMTGGFDNWGHIGGLVGGTIFAWFAGPAMVVRGAFPNFELKDRRESAEVLRAGITVGAVFVLLTAITFYMRLQ